MQGGCGVRSPVQGRVVRAPPVLCLGLAGQSAAGWRDAASLLSCVQPTLDVSHLSQGAPQQGV